MPKNTQLSVTHHYVRTIFASLFGILALGLILASILVVWVNRTLTDTETYTKAVAPLVTKPEVQELVTLKVSDALIEGADPAGLISRLLPQSEIAGKTSEQMTVQLRTVINQNVAQVVASPSFAKLWEDTNRSAHQALIAEIKTGSGELTLDLSPVIVGVTNELKTTKLSPIADKIEIKPDSAKLNLKGGSIDKVQKYYEIFQNATIAIVVIAIVAAILSVIISVHHTKTLRRIVFGTGFMALLIALLVRAPSIVKFNGTRDSVEQKASVAIADALFHDLQVACLTIGLVCMTLVLASKIYDAIFVKKVG